MNGKGNRLKAEYLNFKGNCCWVIYGRKEGEQDEEKTLINQPGKHVPTYPYITFMKTKKCPKKQ